MPPLRRFSAIALLGIALALNLAALVLPFVEVSVGLRDETYSLVHTVTLLWQSGFPWLALLVGAFSVAFPFAKLAVLIAVWTRRLSPRWVTTIGSLGKWSMLDLFLVVLLIAVAYDRLLVGAEPQPGLLCFALAISCSMLAGELLHPREMQPSAPRRWLSALGLLLLASAGTILALILPLFVTDAWFLRDVSYSITGLVAVLWRSGAAVPALATALFLVAAPLLRLACLIVAVLRGGRWNRRAALCGRWSMLEPFALALAIFVLEGRTQLPTSLEHGSVALIAAIAVSGLAATILARR